MPFVYKLDERVIVRLGLSYNFRWEKRIEFPGRFRSVVTVLFEFQRL